VEAKIPLAFLAGLVSFATPCVLPLVPGYLAAVSGREVGAGGRRVVLASLPFLGGFTAVFVGLGAAAAAAGGLAGQNREFLLAAAGLAVVVLGFAMMGLLPLPFLDHLAAPALIQGARQTGSSVLLGAAFGLCAAPCIGPVLASILALASEGQTVAQGTFLLLVYSLGLAVPFVAVGVGFDRAMSAFRWLRDRYQVLRVAAGALLVGIGLLLFFDRFWWLNVAMNRLFEFFGIGV
jgi:cytochrome c-type biogenesis protein